MSKPLFRWTCGPVLQQGLDILAESMRKTTKALGVDQWDWVVCHNGLTDENVDFLQKSADGLQIKFMKQNWATCPIQNEVRTPRREDGTFEWNGNKCGGTLWKVCPPRMRMDSYEIIMDNDVIMLKKFHQIDEWLNANKTLVLEEPIRFYGRYDHLFPSGEGPYLNSGFIGLPPMYDFGAEIKKSWEENGSYEGLSQADEQGLLTYTLNKQPNIRVKPTQMVEVLHRDFSKKISGKEEAIHFTQANRIDNHHSWRRYREIMLGT